MIASAYGPFLHVRIVKKLEMMLAIKITLFVAKGKTKNSSSKPTPQWISNGQHLKHLKLLNENDGFEPLVIILL